MASAGDVESDSESFGELWKAVFATYYDAFYNEALADRLVNKWQFIKFRKQYVIKADQLIKADLFLTNGLRIRTQKHVNVVIEQDKEGN